LLISEKCVILIRKTTEKCVDIRSVLLEKCAALFSAFDKLDQFKFFVFDSGLLKPVAGINNSAILLEND
jgi:hypothetical protein